MPTRTEYRAAYSAVFSDLNTKITHDGIRVEQNCWSFKPMHSAGLCMGKKWFVRLGQENLVRVRNYPLQFKTLTGRQVPEKHKWDAKLERIIRRRIGPSKGKPASLPGWYKRGEIEGSSAGNDLIDWKSACVGSDIAR